MEQLYCPQFYQQHFLNLSNASKFCDAYWKAMSKCKTLDEAIMRYGVSKIAFRCAIVVRREKKLRWQQVEPIIGESRYASGLYFDYMQLLHERGVVGQIEIEQIRQTMRLTH